MTWDDFYGRYSDWSESTLKTRISSLEDIGSGDEVVEVCLNICDEKIESQLIRKAMRLGVKFTRDDILELDGELPEDMFCELACYAGFRDIFDEPEDDFAENVRIVEKHVDGYLDQERKTSAGKAVGAGILAGIFKVLFGGKKKHNGRCDGDCANCPAHYGYRHGRWYYGHGHNYGCEFGGNKGGGSV